MSRETLPAIARWSTVTATATLTAAVAWWAVVFVQVMGNTGFPVGRTLPCMLYTSDRCSLAMSLCTDWHFLGIKRYSPELLWIGAAVAVLAVILSGLRNDTGSVGNPDA